MAASLIRWGRRAVTQREPCTRGAAARPADRPLEVIHVKGNASRVGY